MTVNPSPPKWTPPPPASEAKPIVHRSINLRVDLRALAALGGALIIIGSVLPWVAPQFQPIVRVIGPATSGGWPILVFGVLAIVLQFWPQFRTPRVSLPAAALGFAAGIMALSSALTTIGLGRTLIGEQTISPLTGVGIGIYLTLAGSLIAVLAGLAPQPANHEPARAELRLWKASTAVFGAMVVLCGLGAVLFGSWIGSGGTSGNGTPTPSALDAGILATPLINVEVNPLGENTGSETTPTLLPEIPTEAPSPTPETIIPTRELPPTVTSTSTPTRVPSATLTPATLTSATSSPTASPTGTLTPTPSATTSSSPLDTPTTTPTSTPTPTTIP